MTRDNDMSLVRTVQDGHADSFSELVDRHKDRVYGTLMRLTGDPQVAEELAHETFVRAYMGIGGFSGKAKFSTWLLQIAVNLTRDRLRERQRRRLVSLDELLEQDIDSPALAERRRQFDPLDQLDEHDLLERFERALEDLPPNYREVFVLHHMEGLSYEDIASTTGVSVGSLKVRSHRARKLLKEMLFPDGEPTHEGVVD
jgi:RNA polymerase sigma-70 factor (ECF subfamily)